MSNWSGTVKCLQVGRGLVTWVWISACPVYSLARIGGFRASWLHMMVFCRALLAVLLQCCSETLPFQWGDVREYPSPVPPFGGCFLGTSPQSGWKYCWFCVAVQHTTIPKCFLTSKCISGGHCSFSPLFWLFLETFSFLFHSPNYCSALTL